MQSPFHVRWLTFLLIFSSAAASDIDGEPWVPFHLPWESPTGAVADARFLLDAPAGKHGPLVVRDGHFYFQNGKRVKFWGVNLSGEGCLPPPEVAPRVADRLAKFGFNLVRFHGLDSTWGNTLFPKNAPDTQHFDPGQLDRLDRMIAELEKRGIYANLNLHVARRFTAGDGVPQAEMLGYGKYCVIFNPRMIELQKDYARQLLGHRNPYTGRTYAEDPAVVIVELTNENSLFGGWTSGFLRGKATQRPTNTTWTDIPPYYGEELTRLFNQWLVQRYPTRAALAAAWNEGSRPAGVQLLKNADFAAGTDGWELSRQKSATATLEATHDTPGGKPCAKVTVTAVDDTPWHIMLTQRPLKLQQGMKYRVAFRARALEPRRLNAEVCHSSPYRGYGSARFELGNEWRDCQFTFVAPENDGQVRLSFQFGDTTGTAWISDVLLHEAPVYGLRDDEDPHVAASLRDASPVRRLEPEEFASHTPARFRDEGRFYYDLESGYNRDMVRFLKEELKLQALVQGTNHNYGLPCLRAESLLDLMDCHAYWQHPRFPRQPWSRTDWEIGNTPMLDAPAANCISQLSRSAVAGKPLTVSEYNHPFPNEYGCEMPLLLAAYASLQDWDAIYGYTFLHRYDARSLGGDCVTGYFDLANEVSKMVQMPTASLLFQRGDVQPAKKLVSVSYDENRTYDSLQQPRWDRTRFYLDGDLSPLLPLVHRFRVARFDAPATTRVADLGFTPPEGRIAADTGELMWEAGEKRTGRLTIDTPRVQAAVGWIGGQTVRTADAEFRLKTPFCAVSLVALDDQPLVRSKQILLVAAARCANTGMKWNVERTSISDQWGTPPLLIEAVAGQIALQRGPQSVPLQLVPLDGCGRPRPTRAAAAPSDRAPAVYELVAAAGTAWYVLSARTNSAP
ncbi:MAG TPA: carbohydrate binding domain-containing protein [Candidatus Anammoximicrobium sp.]|nr:carbohydrate binding domain-containing protein [Candidatus Anammoximicrobium sp.]